MTTDLLSSVCACVHAYSIVTIAGPNPHLLDNKGCMAWWQKPHHLFSVRWVAYIFLHIVHVLCYQNHNVVRLLSKPISQQTYIIQPWLLYRGVILYTNCMMHAWPFVRCVSIILHHVLSVLFFSLPLNRYGSSLLFQECKLRLWWSIYDTWHKWWLLCSGFLILYYIRKWRLPTVHR